MKQVNSRTGAKVAHHERYEWLFVSLGTLSLGLCAEWLMLFGEAVWRW